MVLGHHGLVAAFFIQLRRRAGILLGRQGQVVAFHGVGEVGNAAPLYRIKDDEKRTMPVRGKGCAYAPEIVTVTLANLEVETAQPFMEGVHRRNRVR